MPSDERKDQPTTPEPAEREALRLNIETVRDLEAEGDRVQGGAVAVSRYTCDDGCRTLGCL
jgi:hypothetical protein